MRGILCLLVFPVSCLVAPPSWSDDGGAKAKSVFNEFHGAVVTVRLVLKEGYSSPMGSDQSETTAEATGVIIGEDGLTVMSLSEADPSGMWADLFDDEDGFQFEYSSQISDVKLICEGGKEVPAKVALRDKDLDLAFLLPTDSDSEPFPFVPLDSESQPDILDQLVVLDRMSRAADRAPHVCLARLEGIITKPRTYYVADRGGLGAPVFTLEGTCIGLVLSYEGLYDEDSDLFYSLPAEGLILPASEIVHIADMVRKGLPSPDSPAGEPAP